MVQKLIEMQAPRPGGAHRLRQSKLEGGAAEPAVATVQAIRPRPAARAYRAYAEILQEIRIAQTGSQVLLGFLLSMGFTERFSRLSPAQLVLYVAILTVNVASTTLLIAPTVFRQLNFHRQMDRHTLTAANRCVLAGIILLMCAIVGSLLFALSSIFQFKFAAIVATCSLLWFTVWWFVFPMWSRSRHAGTDAMPHDEPAARLSPVPQASR